MKFHKSLVGAVVNTLSKIMEEGQYADKAVEQVLKQNAKWGSRDRKFIAETIYEMVRWKRLLIIALADEEGINTQFLYRLFATLQLIKGIDLPDWEEFKGIDKKTILKNAAQAKKTRKYRESIPNWLDELGVEELGEKNWEREIAALNKEANVVLRVNTLKSTKENVKKLLEERNIETFEINTTPSLFHTGKNDTLVLSQRQRLQNLEAYKNGLFEIQDASSQLIAPFMELGEGMTVIDACAGAGGKALHIASIMENKGEIISMDVEERKLIELNKRADRAGIKIIKTKKISPQTINQLKNTADRLLLDVPCSGLGVLKRNPDAKWKLSVDFIEQIKKKQQEIIQHYSTMLKPGGIMVYATCSILPSENQKQVDFFLNSNSNFEFIEDRKVMPSEGFDGFYMAKLRKK